LTGSLRVFARCTDVEQDSVLSIFRLSSPRKFCIGSAAAFTLAATALPAVAQSPVLVVDASTGQVLISEDATRPWKPASTTKMMTTFVALRAVQSGRLTLDTPLIASANAARQKPSKIGIRPGQEITLDNALKILMVKSANDLAVVIAESVGGSVDGFSAMMNAEARRLGMNESRFSNPHGFDAPGHQSSARDLAILARAMMTEMPQYSDYWGTGAVQLGNRLMYNTNGLMGRYSGASGFKTGFVCASGFNLVSSATRGGRTLIAVVLGASSGGDRTVRSAQLLDQAFGMWGGNGQTLRTLPSSGYSSAPNMRGQICSGRRRGVTLADDSDYGGAIFADTSSGENMGAGSPLAFFATQGGGNTTRSYGAPRSSGRSMLGPRSGISPVAVYLGRAPGSTAVAIGPGGRSIATSAAATSQAAAPRGGGAIPGISPGIPDRATAIAPTGLRTGVPGLDDQRPAAAAAIRPAAAPVQPPPQPAVPRRDDNNEAAGTPLQLGGVNTQPTAASQATIRPRAGTTTNRPQAQQGEPRRQTAQSNQRTAQPPKARPTPPKATPKARPKPADADE
jgi:D-alanyl-D-alanine carboxypeptidase